MTIFKLSHAVLLICVLVLTGCKSAEEKAEEAYERALEFIATGDDPRARIELRNALQEYSEHFDSHLELARLNIRDGNDQGAFRWYRGVVEQDPDHTEGLQELSRIAFLARDWETFDRYAPRAVKAAPDDSNSQVLDLAQRYREVEDDPKREALLAEAEKLAEELPDNAILRQLRIDAYLNLDRFEDALSQLNKSIERNPESQALYELKLQVLSQLGDRSGIRDTLRAMIEVFPDNTEYQQGYLQYLISRNELDTAEEFLEDRMESADPQALQPYINLVAFKQRFRSNEDALAAVDKHIANNPGFHMLRSIRAGLLFDMGRRDEAISELEALLALEENAITEDEHQRVKVVLARMLLSDGNEVGARRLVEEILETTPDNAEALKMQASWLIEQDKTSEAITALRTALAKEPEDAQAMTLMAAAYERAGNTDLRLDFLSLAVEASNNATDETVSFARALLANDRLEQAESALIEALRIRPRDEALLSFLGQIYLRQDDRPRLRQVIQTLRDIGSETALKAASGFDLALISREDGRDRMMEALSQLAEGESADDRTKLALIQNMLEGGETEKALNYVDELVEKNPDNDGYKFFKALTLAATQDFKGAEAILSDIVNREPRSVLAWMQLARIQRITKSPEVALATVDKGLEAMPGYGDLLWSKASMLEQLGRIDETIQIYEQMYEQFSNSPVVANNLASLLTAYQDDEESLERARVIARRLRDTDVPAFQDTYGWIAHRTGNSEEALQYLEPAARALENDPLVQVHLGMVYQALGRTEDAKNQLSRARAAAGPLVTDAISRRIEDLETAVGAD